ncbi:MAG: inorganic diphosphatase [Sphingomonadaceae bacterium]|nr:inorganic diphosphatase [Sphingomonadaceae bacterium]
MDILKIPAGTNPPWDVNAIIEIPQGSTEPVKYEFDKASGALFVDRFLGTPMYYPVNYGFIPHTLSEDGDPIDIMVLAHTSVVPGCVIRCRPIGALLLKDESGGDEKVIAVPVDKLNPYYGDVKHVDDLRPAMRAQIAHFFEHYKDLERGKWVSVGAWVGPEAAARLIQEAIDRAAAEGGPA